MIKNFKCCKCDKELSSKFNLQRHLTRKIPCKAIIVNKCNQDVTECNQHVTECNRHVTGINNQLNNDKQTVEIKKYTCNYCNQEFKQSQGLSRHRNNLRCESLPLIIRNNILKNKKNKKIKEIKEPNVINRINNIDNSDNSNNIDNSDNSDNSNNTNNIDNSDNSNSNNTTNNIININAFGKENLSSITEETKIKILNKRYNGHPYLVKLIFFDIIENRNFYMPNKRDKKFVKIFNGNQLKYENKTNFNKLINTRLTEYSEQWSEECKHKLKIKTHTSLKEMYVDYRNGVLNEEYNEIIEDFLMKYTDEIKNTINENINK